MKLTESNSVNLDKPLAESAVAPGECGSVPDGSDHVAVIGAKPDSVHLAVTSAEPETRLTAAQIAEISSWLDEASDDIDSWGGYAPDYFADKWDLAGAIQSYKDRATKVRALLVAQSGISSLDRRPNDKTFADKTGTFADTSNCFVVGEGK